MPDYRTHVLISDRTALRYGPATAITQQVTATVEPVDEPLGVSVFARFVPDDDPTAWVHDADFDGTLVQQWRLSPRQARDFAIELLKQADRADRYSDPCTRDVPRGYLVELDDAPGEISNAL